MSLLDLLVIISYAAFSIDVLMQLRRVHRTKSSNDLSLAGMAIRWTAMLIILYEFIRLKDKPLIVGQSLLVLSFTFYLSLAIFLRRKHA